ncbi:MAG: ribosome-associated translation inhibitor RaiA [Candidatus Omnitrophica bacterium]|nr:ribosome-associated translation inhibitor RaiA [Candidatus Omnitrophota bacterium]
MDIRYSGKNIRVTKAVKDHLEERIGKLDKYAPRIVESHIVLKKEKYLYVVQVTLLGKDLKVYGEGSEKDNLYAAIEAAVLKVEKQLKRYRDKIKDHRKEHGDGALPPKIKAAARIMKETLASRKPSIIEVSSDVKPMSVEEASLQLELGRDTFLVFSNAATRKPTVIFKLDDGNHGLISAK